MAAAFQQNSSLPLQVMGPGGSGFLTGITAIAAGDQHALALKNDGTVWAWGSNWYGQVGDNTDQNTRYYPTQVYRLTGAAGLAAGYAHSLALKTDGTVMAWGYNNSGQLGDGTTTEQHTPVQVKGPGGVGTFSGAAAVSAANNTSIALRADGTIWTWGQNYRGSLGDGTTTDRWTPVQVVGPGGIGTAFTGAAQAAVGHAVKTDGTIWSWGRNDYGQLGIGTQDTGAHPVPVQTADLSGATVLSTDVVLTSVMALAPQTVDQLSTTYGYDRLYRLTGVSGAGNASYLYDPVGNRASKDGTAYSYDRADRITAAGAVSYTVNANGNLTARGTDSFGYDQANRLRTASVGGTSSSYLYDGDGKRASKTVGGNTTGFVYDVNASLPVLLDDGTRKYVWGIGLAYAVDTSDNPIVYHADGLGSVRALTDGAGAVVQTYRYDEYGVVVASQGSVTQPFQFSGQHRDAETGFVYLRARLFDPSTGRFVQRDTILGALSTPVSLNRFSYGNGNPLRFVDPSGHAARDALISACQRAWGTDYPCDELVTPEVLQDHLSANASFSWEDLESLTQGSPIDKGMFIVATVGSGGKSVVKVAFGHGARHLAGTGLNQVQVERVIAEHVRQMAREAELGVEWWGHVLVEGQVIQYRAYQIAQDVINVGTYLIPQAGKYIRP